MTRRDKIGLTIIIVLFVVLAGLLVLLVRPISDVSHTSPEDSYFVQQRLRILEKNKDR